MTSRVAALSGELEFESQSVSMGVGVTPAMVDSAVDDTLTGEEAALSSSMRHLWATNPDNEVAQMLRDQAAAAVDRARFPTGAKIDAKVPFAMSDDSRRFLVQSFPEFRLQFNTEAGHDHGVAASVRHLDTISMVSQIPPGVPYADFGGNLLMHVKNADVNCVTVLSDLDAKDQSRWKRTLMELRALVRKYADEPSTTRGGIICEMATSVLNGETKYLVRSRLELFDRQVVVGIMSHVYDVPMAAIPFMMERCGMKMLLMTLHFSNRFFDTDHGELEDLGARYKIDRKQDLFEMGFEGSGARWYAHRWSQFQRYGADQVLHGNNRRYSCKIVRRRGDTLGYRVLAIGGRAKPNPQQYYRVPSVPCVRVTTDLTTFTKEYGHKLEEVFPEDVWNRMVREAMLDMSRGTVDYHKFVGNFNQITAGHSYNGVDAVLGSVPVDKIPVLVALSSAAAAAALARLRAGIRFGIEREMESRSLGKDWLAKMVFKLFYHTLKGALTLPLWPILKLFEYLAEAGGEKLMTRLIEVAPVEQIEQIPIDIYERAVHHGEALPREAFPESELRLERADRNEMLQEFVEQLHQEPAEVAGKVIPVDQPDDALDGVLKPLPSESGVSQDASTTVIASEANPVCNEPPAWMPVNKKEHQRYQPQTQWHGVENRRQAIREELRVIEQETADLEAWFALRWADVMSSGKPDVSLMRRKRDEWKELDAWYVQDGIIERSALGRQLTTFKFGGLYCPASMEVVDRHGRKVFTKLRPVDDYLWESPDRKRARMHKAVSGPQYTGYVLVNERTIVYNGPLVAAGLQRALSTPLDFDFGVYIGGPGAGKTYDIVQRFTQGSFITTPLLLSAEDVRKMLGSLKGMPLSRTIRVARTIDSILCAAGKGLAMPVCREVLSDEAFNGRAARAYAAWGLLRPKYVVAYGDKKQIPPVDPSGVTRLYPEIMPRHVVKCFLIKRHGPEHVALYNHRYNNELRSVIPPGKSRVHWLKDASEAVLPAGSLHMSMYQAQKQLLRKLFPNELITTTHEAQGKSVPHAFLGNMDTRQRPENDPFDLFNDEAYMTVGMSRAKEDLYLLDLSPRGTLMGKWYRLAQDPRRIAACADVSTAGQNIELL